MMRPVLFRLSVLVVFTALLLAVMYLAVQNRQSEPEVILYDQYDNVSAKGWGAFNDIFDDKGDGGEQVADDFVVPVGQTWTVNQIEVAGMYVYAYEGEKASSMNVMFSQDADLLPKIEISAQRNLSYTVFPPDSAEVRAIPIPPTPSPGADTTHASFLISIKPVILRSGTYWLSVQANMSPSEKGPSWQYFWLWQWRTAVVNHPASGERCNEDPTLRGDPSSGGCADLVFRLRGYIHTEGPTPAETPTKTLPTVTSTATQIPIEPTNTAIMIAPTSTATESSAPTQTPETILTNTAIATSTTTATHTSMSTEQPSKTATCTPTAEATSTPTTAATSTASETITSTPTSTPTIEPTATPTVRHKGDSTPIWTSVTATVTTTATPTVPHKPPPQP